jgi:prolyl-tRNA synthetase
MHLSKLLGKTLRQPPSDAHLTSHQLLVRAAHVRTLEAGLFTYLPLGQRVLDRLRALVRMHLVTLGGQELDFPLLPGAESAVPVVRLVSREVDSYRQLPVLLFQAATRATSQAGTRAGLFGASQRPFVELYTFGDELETTGEQIRVTLNQIVVACDLEVVWAEAGDEGQRVFYVHPSGDESMVHCPDCSYAAARPWATTTWHELPKETELSPEEIETPGCDTIASLAEFLDIPESRTLKMVFYSVEGKVTCVVIRGDRAVDEAKLARLLGTDWYYASLEDELAAIGAVGGYASPIGLDQSKVRVVADPSVRSGRNFVSGANRPDYHIRNVNIPRDFRPGEWADLALIEAGDPCPRCGAALNISLAFALASSSLPRKVDAEYLDPQGRNHPLWLQRWALDLGRVLAAIVEGHHDGYGILWPAVCAPFDVHLVGLDLRKEAVVAQVEALYGRLQAEGFAVLYDDRDASAGVKFNDADLIGIPLRLTVSKRSVKEGLIEAKWRDSRERLKLDEEGLALELARLR